MNWLDERGNVKEKKMKDCPECEGAGLLSVPCVDGITGKDCEIDTECTHCNGTGKVETDFFDEVDRAYDEIKHERE
jgi:DnaJ-class molecular chaperone